MRGVFAKRAATMRRSFREERSRVHGAQAPLPEIGRRAAELLIEKFENRAGDQNTATEADEIAATLPVIFEPSLVVRGSTAPPPV